jgi:protein-L-isoaspartate(D-aspartate) O-methyltransferase
MLHHRTTDNSCPKHSEEELNFYCKQDKRLICQKCLLSEHLGHDLSAPKDSEIGGTLTLMDEFQKFSKEFYQQKYDTSRALNSICTEIDEKFQNFFDFCEKIKTIIKYDYVVGYKRLSGFLQQFDSLDKDIRALYDSIKTGKAAEGNDFQGRFDALKTNYKDQNKLYTNVEDNSNYNSFMTIKSTLQELYDKIAGNIDMTELNRPEYEDIENSVNYLIDEKTYVIRYKLRSHPDNQALFRKLGKRLESNEFATNILMSIDRKDFTHSDPYTDAPGLIGWNTTVSAPHMHFMTLCYLARYSETIKGGRAIDIGTGSGIMALALCKLLGPKSRVVALDHIEEIVNFAKANINKHNSAYLNRIDFVTADGSNGYAEGGPYDIIHLGAAVESITNELLSQLKNGGLLWAPVGPKGSSKTINLVIKDRDGHVTTQKLMAVNYAEMCSVEQQINPRQRSSSSLSSDSDNIYA